MHQDDIKLINKKQNLANKYSLFITNENYKFFFIWNCFVFPIAKTTFCEKTTIPRGKKISFRNMWTPIPIMHKKIIFIIIKL